jgi:hypothetical protein
MKRILIALVILVAAPSLLAAQAAGSTVDFPCKLTDYRILRPDTIMVRCDGVSITDFTADVSLYKLLDESVAYPAVETREGGGSGPAVNYPFWLKFSFTQPLQPGQDYELRFMGSYRIRRPGNPDLITERFSSTRFRLSTRPDLAVAKVVGRQKQKLSSHFAVQLSPGAKLFDKSTSNEYDLSLASTDPDDPDAAGQILLDPEPTLLGQKLEARGITDVFGQTPTVKPPKAAPPPAAPKTKEAASWHFNVLHQMGEGTKPTWIADVKVAPVLRGLPGGFFITPSINVDTGNGQVGQTKTNDIINPKFGVTRLVRTQSGILEGMKFSPALSYETNRKRDKRNILFDGDLRIYLRGFENTKAQRSQDAFLRARLWDPKVLPQDVPQARFGYSVKLFLGTEIGTSLTDNAVKSSDKSSSVTVPKYAIRRLRPRFSGTIELWRFTASLSLYPRFLFSAENVTREIDTPQSDGTVKKTILLSTVSGWRPYGELSISYAFDPAGHYAVNTVYKFGSQSPNFDHTNLVQSGIVIRF